MEQIKMCITESIVFHNRKICKIMSRDFLSIDISIPNAQRIRDDDKVNDIVAYQCEQLKTKGYCNIMGVINIHYCKSNNELYLVDGQHRYEAIRKISETNNIPLSFELISVDTMEELRENYKILKPLFNKYGYGFYSPEDKTIILNGERFINSNLDFNDLKFVEAHEITHLLLGHTGPYSEEDEMEISIPNFIIELNDSNMFIEANSIVIDQKKYLV